MIENILPAVVAWKERFDHPSDGVLFPEEAALLRKAVDTRRRDFTTGRLCARAALAQLGLPSTPILSGHSGEPRWPAGVVGSITHCPGYTAATVARTADLLTVGIDAEPDDPLPAGVLDVIAGPEEVEHLRALAGARGGGPAWDRLLFCAKEAVYKAWFPMTGRWLGFEDVAVTIDPAAGSFDAHLLVPGPDIGGEGVSAFSGRWLACRGLVLSAVAVPAPSR